MSSQELNKNVSFVRIALESEEIRTCFRICFRAKDVQEKKSKISTPCFSSFNEVIQTMPSTYFDIELEIFSGHISGDHGFYNLYWDKFAALVGGACDVVDFTFLDLAVQITGRKILRFFWKIRI